MAVVVPSEWCARLTKWNIHETRLKLNVEDTFFTHKISKRFYFYIIQYNNRTTIEETKKILERKIER